MRKLFRKDKPYEEHDMYTLYEDQHTTLSDKVKVVFSVLICVFWALTLSNIVYALWLLYH